jgi:hypothetical protein
MCSLNNLNASNIFQNPTNETKSLEFRKFHDLSKSVKCNLTLAETQDPWFVGVNDNNVLKSFKENSIVWYFEELKIAFYYTSTYYVSSHSMGSSGQSIVYNRKTQQLSVYDFEVQKMNANNILNVQRTGIDGNGRFYQKGKFNLLSNVFEWGAKEY